MLSSRWAKALATGALALASLALVLFVAGIFSQGSRTFGMRQSVRCGVGGNCTWNTTGVGERGMGRMMDAEDIGSTMMGASPNIAISARPMPMMDKSIGIPPMMRGTVVSVDRKVSVTASLDMRAKSLDWTVDKIRSIVKNVGGFVESASISQPEAGVRTAWMTVKVPADRFDSTLAEVKQSADQVVNESTGATDMTAQSIDIQAQLNNKRAEEKAYQNILTSATKTSDVVEVTQQLTQVRTEIESLEQQARYLEGQTALATLNLNITEDPQVQAKPGEFQRGNVLKAAVTTLLDALVALGSGLVVFLISGLPILLILLLVLWGVYRLAKRMVERLFSGI